MNPWRALLCAAALMLTDVSSTLAEPPLDASPVTPGFWSWPREKAVDAQAVSNACQDKIAVQFADGRYFGLKLRGADKKTLPAPVMDEVGSCRFDRVTQIEQCELRVNQDDGTAKTGAIESTFVIGADRSIKMTVTPKVVAGKPVSEPSFDVFPVQCPDAVVWGALNGAQAPK